MIPIISYNILSPELCQPNEFNNYDPEYLSNTNRKNKLVVLIDSWLNQENKPIICLQEVSFSWKGILEKIFINNNYLFFTINYGYRKNGYMGVAIAVPSSYQIDRVEYIHISDYITTQPQSPPNFITSFLQKIPFLCDETPDPIIDAKKRSNIAIRLTLTGTSKFILYNYHMPCAFKTPIVQTLHLDALKKLMFSHQYLPTILATDFNIQPNSDNYNYLISASLPSQYNKYLLDSSHYFYTLLSSYKEANQTEPEYTCYSDTKWGGLFQGTLDYIFVSEHFTIISSKLLIKSDEKMPNNLNPSDHFPIMSELEI